MANVLTNQTIIDGDRNLVVKLTGVLDTSNVSRTKVIDVSTFDPAPTQVSIWYLSFSISDGIEVLLDWDATTPVTIMPLAGREEFDFSRFGGLQNNAATAGFTGDIYLTTYGYSSGTVTYSIVLEMVKQGT